MDQSKWIRKLHEMREWMLGLTLAGVICFVAAALAEYVIEAATGTCFFVFRSLLNMSVLLMMVCVPGLLVCEFVIWLLDD